MAEKAMCPICATRLSLTPFGLLPGHPQEPKTVKRQVPCTGSGYTVKEAMQIFGRGRTPEYKK
jgi:hypothetical protein